MIHLRSLPGPDYWLRTCVILFVFLSGWGLQSCKSNFGSVKSSDPIEPKIDASSAVQALQQSDFKLAQQEAERILKKDPTNPLAHAVAGLVLYKKTMHDFIKDVVSIGAGMAILGGFNQRYAIWALNDGIGRLDRVADHLRYASRYSEFSMDLCLACWRVDWNRNGTIDEQDQWVLEIEYDAKGDSIPRDDPRRRPTFRFDVGDVYWAQAMINFQRAVFRIVLAYDFSKIDSLFSRWMRSTDVSEAKIVLVDKKSILLARDLLQEGFEYADRARQAYLEETDDNNEWLPNPRQKNHPLPLPIDNKLYDTWEKVLRNLREIIAGREGLSVTALAQLGDHQWENPPRGFINVGKIFEQPGDIVLNRNNLDQVDDYRRDRSDVEAVLKDIFGDKYVQDMPASPITNTLSRMRGEIERGEESLERKLRYLFWLN